jgi:hypothetical protein
MIVRTAAIAAALLVAALTAPVAAQTAEPATADPYRDQRALPDPADPTSRDALLKARGEAYHRASDAQQTEEELRTTRALNDEIAAQNALADKTDADNRLDYDAALARHQIEVSQAEEQARAAAETARLAQEKYDRDYAAWQEQVRLCRTGFRPACTARPAWVAPAQ